MGWIDGVWGMLILQLASGVNTEAEWAQRSQVSVPIHGTSYLDHRQELNTMLKLI